MRRTDEKLLHRIGLKAWRPEDNVKVHHRLRNIDEDVRSVAVYTYCTNVTQCNHNALDILCSVLSFWQPGACLRLNVNLSEIG